MSTELEDQTQQVFYCELRSFPVCKIEKLSEKMRKLDTLSPYDRSDVAVLLYMGALDKNEEKEALDIWKKAKTDNAYLYLSIHAFTNYDLNRGFVLLEKASSLGNKIAMLRVALCCSLGIGTEVNPERAYNLYKKLTLEDKEPTATYFYGSMILLGSFPFVTEPVEQGIKYIQWSAENGCKYAEFERAYEILKRAKTKEERANAYKLIKHSADKNEPRAMMFYATALSKGEVQTENACAVKKYVDACAVLGYKPAIEAVKLVQMFKRKQRA